MEEDRTPFAELVLWGEMRSSSCGSEAMDEDIEAAKAFMKDYLDTPEGQAELAELQERFETDEWQ